MNVKVMNEYRVKINVTSYNIQFLFNKITVEIILIFAIFNIFNKRFEFFSI